MPHVSVILLAAGEGRRLAARTSKPLVRVAGLPLLLYSLRTFGSHPLVRDIVVVVNRKNRQAILGIIKRFRIRKVRTVVLGGRERQDSVRCGFGALASGTDLVAIHDAARPFISASAISSAIAAARHYGASIVGVPVHSTIKRVAQGRGRPCVKETVDRSLLWEAQTPQVFETGLLRRAFRRFGRTPVTDDAMFVEKLGSAVTLVRGSAFNIKITAPEDLVLAEAIARRLYASRAGRKRRR